MMIGSIDGLVSAPARAREGVAVSGGAPAAAPASRPPPTPQEVSAAVSQANEALHTLSQAVEFSYDPQSQVTVIRVVDTEDHQVLRQVPSREMLEIAQALEHMQTMLIRSKA